MNGDTSLTIPKSSHLNTTATGSELAKAIHSNLSEFKEHLDDAPHHRI